MSSEQKPENSLGKGSNRRPVAVVYLATGRVEDDAHTVGVLRTALQSAEHIRATVHALDFDELLRRLFAYRTDEMLVVVLPFDPRDTELRRGLSAVRSQLSPSRGAYFVVDPDKHRAGPHLRGGAAGVYFGPRLAAVDAREMVAEVGRISERFDDRVATLQALLGLDKHSKSGAPVVPGAHGITGPIGPAAACPTTHLCDVCVDSVPESVLGATWMLDELAPAAMVDRMAGLVFDWDFSAHDLSYNELLACACAMLEYAAARCAPEWALPRQRLVGFLAVVRNLYCADNPYHNYRHAIDVLQAMFYFLIRIGCLPDRASGAATATPDGVMPDVQTPPLTPVQTLAVLVAALGHDVGHPGVTNAFLVTTNAPLARIYNERSVLESFHSASFNQVLRLYWPQLVADASAREVVTQAVLATDMAMHFEYMKAIEAIDVSGGFGPEHQLLLCSIMTKCADISNVARTLLISSRWGETLTAELVEIADLEHSLGLAPTASKLGPNASAEERQLALARSQLFFIGTYGRPLFTAVSRVLPQLAYTTDIIDANAARWERVVAANGAC